MKQSRRLFLFLLLNVLISACTTLVVLILWDQASGPLPKGLLPRAWNDLAAPTAIATPAPGETPAPQAAPTGAFILYQVQPGDTLDGIAAKYSLSVQELLDTNKLPAAHVVEVGETLRIPLQSKGDVIIDSVIGAGDLNTEHVLLKYNGEGQISLVGWRLEDQVGNVFIFPQFPQLILFGGGGVNIYTKAGNNSVVELYWGLERATWSPGTQVTLRDAQGRIQATYTVP